jgi:hypothetical protein
VIFISNANPFDAWLAAAVVRLLEFAGGNNIDTRSHQTTGRRRSASNQLILPSMTYPAATYSADVVVQRLVPAAATCRSDTRFDSVKVFVSDPVSCGQRPDSQPHRNNRSESSPGGKVCRGGNSLLGSHFNRCKERPMLLLIILIILIFGFGYGGYRMGPGMGYYGGGGISLILLIVLILLLLKVV